MKIEWIEYKEKKILFIDYKGCKSEEDQLTIFEQYLEILKTTTSKVLVLHDFTDNFASDLLLQKAKESSPFISKRIKKSAFLGVTGTKKFLLNFYKLFSKIDLTAFDSKNEALKFLVK